MGKKSSNTFATVWWPIAANQKKIIIKIKATKLKMKIKKLKKGKSNIQKKNLQKYHDS